MLNVGVETEMIGNLFPHGEFTPMLDLDSTAQFKIKNSYSVCLHLRIVSNVNVTDVYNV